MEEQAACLSSVSLLQEESTASILQNIDQFIGEIEDCTAYIANDDVTEEDARMKCTDLFLTLKKTNYPKSIGNSRKSFRSAVTKLGKSFDKNNISTYQNMKETDSKLMNQAIAQHFSHEGQFDICKTFVEESKLDQTQFGQEPYATMHQILNKIQEQDIFELALWTESVSEFLMEQESQLEFLIRRIQFIEILMNGDKIKAVRHSQKYFPKFSPLFMDDIKKMMMLLTKPVDRQLMLQKQEIFASLRDIFVEDFCAYHKIPKHSLLYTTTLVGTMALPGLTKMATLRKIDDWSSLPQLPVEIELPGEFRFHSVFICPISKENTTEANPPTLLECGHVISQAVVEELSKSRRFRFKCPYCPTEQILSQSKRLYF